MSERIGVAISTTGDEHRLDLLGLSISQWRAALGEKGNFGSTPTVFVTVDGDDAAMKRVIDAVGYEPVGFYQVGEPLITSTAMGRDGRLGVATNKNTGLELLMDAGVEHLFLSDDDTWPKSALSLELHTEGPPNHSMVNWGAHRYEGTFMGVKGWSAWSWPRGSVLYVSRKTAQTVGGMVEAFGPGGHEHVEWSRRIHQNAFTGTLYPSPNQYASHDGMGARQFWHAEDMPRRNERRANLISRRRRLTSVRRRPGDWTHITEIMDRMDGKTDFVPYAARDNGRESATLYENH